MAVSDVYGPILTEGDVRHAAEETLKLWLPSYLGEVAAQHGMARDTLPLIRSWKAVPVFEQWPEEQLPAIVVVAPGTNSVPEKMDNKITVGWSLGVAVIVSAKDEESTADLIGLYSAAIRALLSHKGSLGGFAEGSTFMSERFDEHPIPEQGRTLRTAMVMFSVLVAGMNKVRGGPRVADDPTVEPEPWPIVTSVHETVIPLSEV